MSGEVKKSYRRYRKEDRRMQHRMKKRNGPAGIGFLLSTTFLLLCLGACNESGGNQGQGFPPTTPIEPSAGYLNRQAEYLTHCNDNNGPGQGGIHGQVCRAFTGAGSFNEDRIRSSLNKINNREDTADFDFNSVIRLLYFDRANPTLPDGLRGEMEEAVLNFKYWYEEPGPDTMCWWSENHQILFHTAELMAGQLFPDTVFPNSGMTGSEHVEHALPLLHRWIDFRGMFGFSEWHSNTYFNEDMPPLINLVDFAEDAVLRLKAAMVLDLIAFDMACNYYKGYFATTHGRTYQRNLGEGLADSTREAAYIMLGLGGYKSTGNFSGAFLATSRNYCPPRILEETATHASPSFEHRQRDSIDLEDGPGYGIGYEDHRDVMFWWGMTGYMPQQVVTGTFQMIEDYTMWDGFIWKDIKFLRIFVGSPFLETVAETFEAMARGVVLESVNTYTYRTPDYQLSGAQDFKPGMWAAQTHIWQATLDRDAYVFTTYPGGFEDDYMAGPWTGGFLPRATLHENVGVIQYRRPRIPLLDEILFTDYSHAFFPRTEFDEMAETGNWTLGRKGDAYVALYSQHPTEWSQENDYELIADVKENVWIVELGDADHNGSFAQFVEDISNADIAVNGEVRYDSPSQGEVVVGWEGPMTVGGLEVDLGPYARWDNPYCHQPFGQNVTTLEHQGRRLTLDFETPARNYWDANGK